MNGHTLLRKLIYLSKISLALSVLIGSLQFMLGLNVFSLAQGTIDLWWPLNGSELHAVQPLKAKVEGKHADEYMMFWQVDGGQLNPMETRYAPDSHKYASVDVQNWDWSNDDSYTFTFLAQDYSGNTIAERSVQTRVPSSTLSVDALPGLSSASSTVSESNIAIWWPAPSVTVEGVQPFKAVVEEKSLNDYTMTWRVDNGRENSMADVTNGSPHKEAQVNVDPWNWNGSGPYAVTFTARAADGSEIAEKTISITTGNSSNSSSFSLEEYAQEEGSTSTFSQSLAPSNSGNSGNPLAGARFYTPQHSYISSQINSWIQNNPSDAHLLEKIKNQPQAAWFGTWNHNVHEDVRNVVTDAANTGSVPILIAYNIPNRDCGGYSSGGAGSPDAYRQWIRSFADGIGGNRAVVILEPDALPGVHCLSEDQKNERFSLVSEAISTLKAQGAVVYVDAGHPRWVDSGEIAQRLQAAGISKADGFALNVSNYFSNEENTRYGQEVSQHLGGTHFVVDTSRNGAGAPDNAEWCNPWGRALGTPSTTSTGNVLVDAFLWLKVPGESDGYCNGGPSAGEWWPEYALDLARRSNF